MTDPREKIEKPDIDMLPALLENFALEWEADIGFNKMSDGSEAGPDVKILPREQCSRETTERRIAFVREVGRTVERLRLELAEARANALEEAARVVQNYLFMGWRGNEIVDAIRALAAGKEGVQR